ncbi:MAG: cytochrome c oxidase subunit 3 family protein [Ignavibacteriales bacterium]|nr:cytochrome c oxidase subunit 3 family protein [Ignavibacteriales bacterium]
MAETQDALLIAGGDHVHRDDVGIKLGMWLFLFTELILFGGLFLVYAVYRYLHPQEFHLAAQELDALVGTINTILLLTSSLTVAMSITAIREGRKWLSIALVLVTIILALAFLGNKYFEWAHKFEHGIYPRSPLLLEMPPGEILYFGLYFVMTGIHALHVIIGMVVLGFSVRFLWTGVITEHSYVRLEAGALYWHLVDIIWIFLFPLFYLLH